METRILDKLDELVLWRNKHDKMLEPEEKEKKEEKGCPLYDEDKGCLYDKLEKITKESDCPPDLLDKVNELTETGKPEKHICKPKPVKTMGLTQYQCGCGAYFSKAGYDRYMESRIT